jgi:hypothetical protein
MRIALLNCYLQGGHTENAEVESTARFAEAARRMGIDAKVFARSEDIAGFAPDFVLSLSYNDAKLTGFPTYVLLTAPSGWFSNLPRFLRNVLSYDGYWTVSPSVSRFVGALYAKAGKPDLGAFAAISYVRTEFVPLDFSRARAAYLGTNWDGQRHGALFGALAPMGVARFHGKRERWAHLPEAAFGGEVAFDGVAVIDAYRSAGIGLCLNHPDFDAEGIPTSRVFEVPAASALMIAGRNKLIEDAFGDAALYIDSEGAPEAVAGAIRDHVEWVRAHPKRALEMAEASHRVFNERFALEALLANAQEMHRRARTALGFAAAEARGAGDFAATAVISVRDGSLRHFERCLDSVLGQTLAARRVIVLDGTSGGRAAPLLRARANAGAIEHRRGAPRSGRLGAALARVWRDLATEWACCLSADDVLYPNHLFAAAAAARRHRAGNGGSAPALIHSGLAQLSDSAELPELMNDRYNVPRAERMRLAQFDFGPAWASAARLPLHPASCLLHVPTLSAALRPWPRYLFPAALASALRAQARSGRIAFTAAVTLATSDARARSGYGRFALPAAETATPGRNSLPSVAAR